MAPRESISLRLTHLGKWVGISSLIGFVSGVAAALFDRLLGAFEHGVFARLIGAGTEGLGQAPGRLWILLLLPAGGLLVGWMTQRFAPEASGHGTEQLIHSFHRLGGKVRRRVIALKALASTLTIGTGGSAGAEGPVTQMGSGIGSALSDFLRFSERDRRIFLLAGSSAGVGALFSAPLGGALFAPEVLYRKSEFEGEAIVPCIISSILAYTTFSMLEGAERRVPVSNALEEALALHDPRELLLYVLLALLCTAVSFVYVRTFEATGRLFRRIPRLPAAARPALGALGVAALALALAPQAGGEGILFGGYGLMRATLSDSLPLLTLALLVPAKIVATSLTIASGGSGGVFAPSLALGALCGALVGGWGAQAFPGLGLEPACYALVGMGGFFAGLAKTPITAIVIVCELTGSYGLLAPLMLVAVLHLLLSQRWTIYDTQVDGLVDSPAHTGDFVVDALDGLRVADVLADAQPPETVRENATLREVLDLVATARSYYHPVVDGDGHLIGIVSLSDVRRIFRASEVDHLVIARDFMVEDVVRVTPDEDLNSALRTMNAHGLHELPVVSSDDPRRVQAMLTRQTVSKTYHERLRRLRQPASA
ncbi:MAG TPA: chloride channel protein [Planctomycetota bacterium]